MIHVQIASDLTVDGVEGVRWVLVEPSEMPADTPALTPAPTAAPASAGPEMPVIGSLQAAAARPVPAAALKALWGAGLVLALMLAWVGVRPGPVRSPAEPAHRPGPPNGTLARPGPAAVPSAPGAATLPAGEPAPQAAPMPLPPAAPASAPADQPLITAGLR